MPAGRPGAAPRASGGWPYPGHLHLDGLDGRAMSEEVPITGSKAIRGLRRER